MAGPPVQDAAAIRDLLQAVIPRQLGRKSQDFVIRTMRGPVPFTRLWILKSGVRPAERRPGLQDVDPWCLVYRLVFGRCCPILDRWLSQVCIRFVSV